MYRIRAKVPPRSRHSQQSRRRNSAWMSQDQDVIIPQALAANCAKNPERAEWLSRLPALLHQLKQRWSLSLGLPFDGDEVSCSWVAPVTLADLTSAVLKIGMPHLEGQHEIE